MSYRAWKFHIRVCVWLFARGLCCQCLCSVSTVLLLLFSSRSLQWHPHADNCQLSLYLKPAALCSGYPSSNNYCELLTNLLHTWTFWTFGQWQRGKIHWAPLVFQCDCQASCSEKGGRVDALSEYASAPTAPAWLSDIFYHFHLFLKNFIYLAVPGLGCGTWDLCCLVWDL